MNKGGDITKTVAQVNPDAVPPQKKEQLTSTQKQDTTEGITECGVGTEASLYT